jgi:pimeloyl-ACP methyl ester carboxylesterase
MTGMTTPQPMRIDISVQDLADLDYRLRHARWPEFSAAEDWSRGVPLAYLKTVAAYWLNKFDWRSQERVLNTYDHFLCEINGQPIHFLHIKSSRVDATPLLITHGWPGSFVEYLAVIEPLSEPERPSDPAFSLVIPSLPGFGFSVPLKNTGWDHDRIAQTWAKLMAGLGYARYGVQGGDTGYKVSPLVPVHAPEAVIGVHVNGGLEPIGDEELSAGGFSEAELMRVEFGRKLKQTASGYSAIQETRPNTIGFSLVDSPIGLLAWIIDKFRDWTDPQRPLPDIAASSLDHILTNVCLYWFTRSGFSSAQLYFENRHAQELEPNTRTPTGVAVFPTDLSIRRIMERSNTIVHWSEFDRGGHFAAMEASDLYVQDVRQFFSHLDK